MGLLMKHDTSTEAATRLYMAETAMAIAHVHTIGYIHRNLKPDNILIDWFGHVKLTDLGLCTRIDKDPMLNVFDVNKHGMEIEEPGMGAKEAKTPEGASSAIQGKGIWAKGNTPPPPTHRDRALVYSTVGTPDYIAPEVLLQKGLIFLLPYISTSLSINIYKYCDLILIYMRSFEIQLEANIVTHTFNPNFEFWTLNSFHLHYSR